MTERKPDGQRLRRNVGDLLPWTDLPTEPDTEIPEVPEFSGLQPPGLAKWREWWSSPPATQWGTPEAGQVVRFCQLFDMWTTSKDKSLLTEMRHLETALGMTPKSRKELRWRIVDVDGEVVELNGKPTGKGPRLKVVDTAS